MVNVMFEKDGKEWSETDLRKLILMAGKQHVEIIAQRLKRSIKCVIDKANKNKIDLFNKATSYSVHKVAILLGCSCHTVYRLMNKIGMKPQKRRYERGPFLITLEQYEELKNAFIRNLNR